MNPDTTIPTPVHPIVERVSVEREHYEALLVVSGFARAYVAATHGDVRPELYDAAVALGLAEKMQ